MLEGRHFQPAAQNVLSKENCQGVVISTKNHIRNLVPHQSPEWWVVHFELLSLPRWLARHGEREVFILLELYSEEESIDFVKISQTFLTRMSSISARISWASAWTVPAILVYLFSTWCVRLNKTQCQLSKRLAGPIIPFSWSCLVSLEAGTWTGTKKMYH